MAAMNLPEDIEARLAALSARTGRSAASYVGEAVREFLDDLEDLELAREEWREIESGHAKTVPLADVMRDYGLDN